MQDLTTSASSRILDHLKTLAPGAEFTGQMLKDALDVSDGSVSGFFHKLVENGAIKITGRSEGKHVYQVVDLAKVVVRATASIGSKPGRTIDGTSSAEKVATLLRQLADQVENFNSDLSSYSNSDLLRELSRRERAASGTKES